MDKTGFLCKHTSHNAYHRMDYITVSETELFAIVYTTSDNILPTHTYSTVPFLISIHAPYGISILQVLLR